MKRAVIDLGTNTFNLLIAEIKKGKLVAIYTDKKPVLLGMGGINEDIITPSAMQRAKDALKLFFEACKAHKVTNISGIGTSALRGAVNSSELVDYALSEFKINIEIVTGQQEADLIYNGVKWSYPFTYPTIIMDIGGGSTEFIHADSEGINKMISLDIGVSRIYQMLNQPAEFTKEHIATVIDFLEEKADNCFVELESDILVGATGSFETLYSLISKTEFPPQNEVLEIPIEKALQTLNWIITSSLEERLQSEWIIPMRKKMLPIAAIKVKWMIEKFGIKEIYVSPCSLKEGVFYKGKK